MLIDTHAHLYWDSFNEDFDEIIQRSLDAGVSTIINVGVGLKSSKTALEQVENQLSKVKGLTSYSTIGLHPHEAVRFAQNPNQMDEEIKGLEEINDSNPDKVVAVGECGLDYAFSTSEVGFDSSEVFIIKNLQRQLFQAQIDLAKKLSLPLIVHCRDDRSQNPENSEAWDEVLKMVGDHPTILHCYSGLPQITQKVLAMPNTLVSFAGTITYPKNDYLRKAAKLLPLDKIVLETDCPFLPPQSKRGQRNEPSNILEIAQLVADLKNISLEEISNQTTENVKKIFNIDPSSL